MEKVKGHGHEEKDRETVVCHDVPVLRLQKRGHMLEKKKIFFSLKI
jgi:hypothetical protein